MVIIFRRIILSVEYYFKEFELFYLFIFFCVSLDVGKESLIGVVLVLIYVYEFVYVYYSENYFIKIYVYKYFILVLMFF